MAELFALESLNPSLGLRASYDAVLVSAGFESRAIYAMQALGINSDRRVACAFANRQVGKYSTNSNWLRTNGFEVQEVQEHEVLDWTSQFIDGLVNTSDVKQTIKLCVDISSMSRTRIAAVLSSILDVKECKAEVDFLYSVAKWSPPSMEPEPIVSAGAVLPSFAGWSSQTDSPIVALIGLGYEPDKAVGAYEYLEATDVWTFLPRSEELQYADDVAGANRTLISRLGEQRIINYRVDQPVACFGLLESIVFGLLPRMRPVLLPFGPKIFALCAMLVACYHRELPVWRISANQYAAPLDREASGKIIAMRVVFDSATREAELSGRERTDKAAFVRR